MHFKKIPETPNFTRFTESKWRHNEEYQHTMTKIQSILKVVRIHQHAKFDVIPPLCSQESARKSQIWPVSQSQNATKMRKINRRSPKSNLFSRWSGYTSMSNFRPFKVTAIKRNQLYLWCHHKCDQTRNVCLLNHLGVSSWKIKSCCNNSTDEESTFNIHITWTQDNVKGANLTKLPKFKFWNFSQNSTRDTPSEVCWQDV